MAIAQQRRPLTLDEFLRLPEQKPALEFEDGEIKRKVSPKGKHSTLQGRLVARFSDYAEHRKLGFALPELRTTYAGRSTVPDVAYFRWDRLPFNENGELEDDFFIPPDIAIEILSPGQSVSGRVRRCSWYVANGVSIALFVNPIDRTVRLFRPDQRPRVLEADDRIDLGGVLPGFALTVADVFALLRIG